MEAVSRVAAPARNGLGRPARHPPSGRKRRKAVLGLLRARQPPPSGFGPGDKVDFDAVAQGGLQTSPTITI